MWNLSFISEQEFTDHVKATIEKYGEKLESFDLKRFNKNIIDPIKLIFDKTVYHSSWDEIVSNEIFRQRDKSNNNDIGYFHQRIFQYIANCHVPPNGEEGGWDVIYENADGIPIPDAGSVHKVYVEMKNKHNTINSASAGKTFIKMQNQLLNDDDCACFLVEAIAQRSQNIKWETTVDKRKVGHKLIRRVSLDQFYALVTGQDDAFYQMCMVLPSVIEKAVKELDETLVPHDTVIDELKELASKQNIESEDLAIAMAAYMLGFGNYPFVLNYIDFLYKWFFPFVFIATVLLKIIIEIVKCTNIMGTAFDSIIAVLSLILWVSYLLFLHPVCIRKQK